MTNNHSVELEVSGSELPLLKNVLNRIELSSSITRVRVEIESDEPFLGDAPQAVESDDSADAGSEAADTSSDDESGEHVCECGDTFESAGGLGSHRRYCDDADTDPTVTDDGGHVTDALADGGATTASTGDGSTGPTLPDADTGQPARRYLDSDLVDRVADDDEVTPDEFRNILTTPLSQDTHKWYICGLLLRTQGSLSLGQITNMLEGTDWEIEYSSVSSTLHNLKAAGYINRQERGVYQLTQLGRDYMQAKITHTTGYSLTTADNITGDE